MAVSNLPATRFGDTITLPSQACSCEQVSSDEVWGHDYVTIAGLWLGATCQRRGLGTRLRYHRELVAERNLPTTRFGDTITLPSQACGCDQLTSNKVWEHNYVTIAQLVAVSNLQTTRFGDTIMLQSRACGDEVWGHDYVTIASLWL